MHLPGKTNVRTCQWPLPALAIARPIKSVITRLGCIALSGALRAAPSPRPIRLWTAKFALLHRSKEAGEGVNAASKLGGAAATDGCRLRGASSSAVASLPHCWAAAISSHVGMVGEVVQF
jgi:hypothetical protein